jgi:DNA mismatch repair protein MutS2
MAQAGLHIPAAEGSTLPVFRTLFADIGDEQSISASLSTFSAHITNIAAMDRAMQLPALVLLDEVGTGTDPAEGGALATAIIAHFKERGALVFATTHYDALKTWGTATDGVTTAAFAFDPHTFAPSYRLIYGAPGRSLAIEISRRLGLPAAVIAAARNYLSDDRKRLDAHLERVDAQARALDSERRKLERERAALADQNAALRLRESAVAEREGRLAKRVNEKLDDRLRQARKDIDDVIAQLKEKSETLIEQASARAARAAVSTGEAGAVRVAAASRACASRGPGPRRRTSRRGRSPWAPASAWVAWASKVSWSRWMARTPKWTCAASACARRWPICASQPARRQPRRNRRRPCA